MSGGCLVHGTADPAGDELYDCAGTHASRLRCNAHPVDDINGLYLSDLVNTTDLCCGSATLHYWEESSECAPHCNRVCWYGNDSPRSRLRIAYIPEDVSTSDYNVPTGAKLMLYETYGGAGSPTCGARGSTARDRLKRVWAHNNIFKAVNSTLDCDGPNTFTNLITSGDRIVIPSGESAESGDSVIPIYFGGSITIRPVCDY